MTSFVLRSESRRVEIFFTNRNDNGMFVPPLTMYVDLKDHDVSISPHVSYFFDTFDVFPAVTRAAPTSDVQ